MPVNKRTSGITRKSQKLELIVGFAFLNPLQSLGCRLYKKYQPIRIPVFPHSDENAMYTSWSRFDTTRESKFYIRWASLYAFLTSSAYCSISSGCSIGTFPTDDIHIHFALLNFILTISFDPCSSFVRKQTVTYFSDFLTSSSNSESKLASSHSKQILLKISCSSSVQFSSRSGS